MLNCTSHGPSSPPMLFICQDTTTTHDSSGTIPVSLHVNVQPCLPYRGKCFYALDHIITMISPFWPPRLASSTTRYVNSVSTFFSHLFSSLSFFPFVFSVRSLWWMLTGHAPVLLMDKGRFAWTSARRKALQYLDLAFSKSYFCLQCLHPYNDLGQHTCPNNQGNHSGVCLKDVCVDHVEAYCQYHVPDIT